MEKLVVVDQVTPTKAFLHMLGMLGAGILARCDSYWTDVTHIGLMWPKFARCDQNWPDVTHKRQNGKKINGKNDKNDENRWWKWQKWPENVKVARRKCESGPTKMWKWTDENVKVDRPKTDMPEVDRACVKKSLILCPKYKSWIEPEKALYLFR